MYINGRTINQRVNLYYVEVPCAYFVLSSSTGTLLLHSEIHLLQTPLNPLNKWQLKFNDESSSINGTACEYWQQYLISTPIDQYLN